MKLLVRIGWLVLLTAVGVTWFARDRLETVRTIHPDAVAAPTQTRLTDVATFTFSRNGYHYEVKPVDRYVLRGLIVHRLDYSWWAIDRSEKVFPLDLCMIWGRNLTNGVYRAPSVRFSQDCRFCWAQWDGAVEFRMDELSNNHLLVNNPPLERQLQRLRVGDQIKLTGQLVNVKATATGDVGRYDSAAAVWQSSTTRTDGGAGACEVIYVESVEILQPGNPLARQLYRVAWIGLLLFAGWRLVMIFRP